MSNGTDIQKKIPSPEDVLGTKPKVIPSPETVLGVKKKDGQGSDVSSQQPSISAPEQEGFRTSFEKGQTSQAAGSVEQSDLMQIEEPPGIDIGTFDYIMEQGASGSLAFKGAMFLSLLDQGVKYKKDNPLQYAVGEMNKLKSQREERFQDYDPSISESVASGLVSLFLDIGPFKGAAEISQAGVKGTTKLYKAAKAAKTKLIGSGVEAKVADKAVKGGLSKLLTQGAQTGGTLGLYGGAQNVLTQLEREGTIEDFSFGETVKTFGKDFLIGVPVGMLGGLGAQVGAAAENRLIENGVSKFISKASGGVLEYGAFTPAEAGVFELGGSMLPDPATGEKRAPTVDGWLSSFGVVLGAKIGGKMAAPRVSESFRPEKTNKGEFAIKLSSDELIRLSDDPKMGMTQNQVIERSKSDKEYKDSMLKNPEIAFTTKAKIVWATEGIEPAEMPRVTSHDVKFTPDGRASLETRDTNGAIVERVSFPDKMSAMQASTVVDASIKESSATERIDNLDVKSFSALDFNMREAGIEGGLGSEILQDALLFPKNRRTAEQEKIVDKFMKTMGEFESPESPPEPSSTKSEGKMPPEGELTPVELNDLNKLSGYDNIEMTQGDLLQDFRFNTKFRENVLNNPDIPFSTKEKIFWLADGTKLPKSYSTESKGKVLQKEEKATEKPADKIDEVKGRMLEKEQKSLDLLERISTFGESESLSESIKNIESKIAEIEKGQEGSTTESLEMKRVLEEIKTDKTLSNTEKDMDIFTVSEIRDELTSKIEQLKTKENDIHDQEQGRTITSTDGEPVALREDLTGGDRGAVPRYVGEGVRGTEGEPRYAPVNEVSIPDAEASVLAKNNKQFVFDDAFYEVDNPKDFHEAITASKEGNKYAAAVFVYDVADYGKDRLFVTKDGKAGVALTPEGDIVSVFSHNEGKGRAPQLVLNAIKEGGTHLDHYDTYLTKYYSKFGFKPVARTKWNEAFAPKDWNKETFKDWNNGEPDVVVMVYEGGDPKTLHERVGKFESVKDELDKLPYSESYEDALKVKDEYLAKKGTKVIDKDGKPLTMYQGRSKKGGKSLFKDGEGWFSRHKGVGVQYADPELHAKLSETPEKYKDVKNEDLKGEVYEVELDIKNPMEVDIKETMWDRGKEKKKILEAKAAGHDGLVITENGEIRDAVVFNESQIKQKTNEVKEEGKLQEQAPKQEVDPPDASESTPYTQKRQAMGISVPIDVMIKTWNRGMKARGLLPKDVFEKWVGSQGSLNAQMFEVEIMQKNFKEAVAKAYKGKFDKAELERVNEVLKSLGADPDIAAAMLQQLPEPMREVVGEMRTQIDALSREMLRLGMIEGDLIGKIDANMGFYLTRGYRAHNDKSWTYDNIPEVTMNRAWDFMRKEYPKMSESQIEGELRSMLRDPDAPLGFLKSSKLGSKDLGILKLRKDIPVQLRDFLGEYKDPLYNYASSVYKMADLIGREKFLNDVRDMGRGKFLFEEKTATHYRPIAAEGSKVMAPLNGLYTTPEMAGVFERFQQATPYSSWIMQQYAKINSAVKYGKTIASPQTHIRNWESNLLLQLANGRFFNTSGKAGDLVRFSYAKKGRNSSEYKEYVKRAIELGVLRDNARAGEMFDVIEDAHKSLNDFAKADDSWINKPLKRLNKGIQKAYQIEDDVHKLYAYGVELQRYENAFQKKYPQKDPSQIRTMAEEKAAEIVRNTMPTYSLVPELLKQMRKFPITGTFISFPAEIIRTTWNVMDISFKEMKDPATRDIGMTRLAGMLSAAGITYGMKRASWQLFGLSKKDDEDMRRFRPPWSKNSDALIISPIKDGVYSEVDMGFSDPLNYIKQSVNAVMANIDNPEEAWKAGVKEFISPFAEEELLFSKLVDVMRNSNKTNGLPVYNEAYPWGDQAAASIKYLWKDLQPGFLSSGKRIVKGAQGRKEGGREYSFKEETLAVALGVRISKRNVGQSFMYHVNGWRRSINQTSFDYIKVLSSEDPQKEKTREATYKTSNEALKTIIMEAHEDYVAALNLGVPKKVLFKHLENINNKTIAGMIVTGRWRDLPEATGKW